MFDREEAISYIWDTYKSIHGIRPRHINFSKMGDAQLQEQVEIIEADMQRYIEETNREIAEAERTFEAMIRNITECGGIGGSPINRSTALRWIADDRRTAQEIEHLLWEHDLIYSRKFDTYLNEILEAIHG